MAGPHHHKVFLTWHPYTCCREAYNKKADVFSFAMLCYHLYEGKPPLAHMNPVEAARAAAETGLRPAWGEVRERPGLKDDYACL